MFVVQTNRKHQKPCIFWWKKAFPKWADAVHLGLVWRDTSCHYSFGGKQTNITLDISTSSCRMHIFRFSKFISYLSGLMWCLRPSLPQLTWCIICRISFDTYVYTAPARKNHVLVCCFFSLCCCPNKTKLTKFKIYRLRRWLRKQTPCSEHVKSTRKKNAVRE